MNAPRCIPLEAITTETVGGKAEGQISLNEFGDELPVKGQVFEVYFEGLDENDMSAGSTIVIAPLPMAPKDRNLYGLDPARPLFIRPKWKKGK